ncbi:chemotaxis protein CheW [Legionella jamestowniensis]|nr:chemotaxis protein CheW [Legionella jamestowniensis]KTD09426.1 chemotaxis signal transduction protein (cheW domain) [Legionella jamestowniensis]SFL89096.1 Chemotaxis signal transduction protein [Legionella jamestowniensis DSM 19215]
MVRNTNHLKIRLNNYCILILLQHVHTVLPVAKLELIPHHASALAGILNFHGQAVPVYHLSELINDSMPEYDLNTPMLICTLSIGLIGLLASEVVEVINVREEMIQKPPVNEAKPYITGLIEKEKWSAWILDLEKLFKTHHFSLEEIHD